MKLRYQGVLYEYYPSQPEAVPQSVLRYRGIFYSREMRSSDYSPEISPSKQRSSGYLNYRLYRLGWQNKQHQLYEILTKKIAYVFDAPDFDKPVKESLHTKGYELN